jgi:hypothetical protein
MTKTINLELTLEELKLIDKYVDGEPETVELFKKIRAAYPKIYTLWDVMRDELGFSVDMCDEIVDAVEKWLPKEQSAAGSQNAYVECSVEGFNDCLTKIKSKLR